MERRILAMQISTVAVAGIPTVGILTAKEGPKILERRHRLIGACTRVLLNDMCMRINGLAMGKRH